MLPSRILPAQRLTPSLPALLLFALLLINPGFASAVDLGPLDVIAPKPEWRAISVSVRHSDRDQLIVDGVSHPTPHNYDVTEVMVRPGTGFQLGEMPGYAFAEMGYRKITTGGALARDPMPAPGKGVTDLTLAAAVWPLADREQGRYLGLGGYVVLPTGRYDTKRTLGLNLNPGGNRFVGILQGGYNQQLNRRWNWMGAADLAFFGDRQDYLGSTLTPGTYEQRPLYTLQTALTYHLHPRVSLAVSYLYNRGGETRSHGGDWDGMINSHRYALWGLIRLDAKTRLNLRYGSSLEIANGLKEDQAIQLRLIRFF